MYIPFLYIQGAMQSGSLVPIWVHVRTYLIQSAVSPITLRPAVKTLTLKLLHQAVDPLWSTHVPGLIQRKTNTFIREQVISTATVSNLTKAIVYIHG